ncbi:mechanosensitive ion channel family protein [Candidatus Manganitrophus noduliformans]|nr:mechanosensitive ion channel family protein [Candidatus Manganitrophus noduliformans]
MGEMTIDRLKELALSTTFAFAQSGFRIILLIVAGLIGIRVVNFLLCRMEDILIKTREPVETVKGSTRKRVTTLVGILKTIGYFSIWSIILISCLDQVGVNVAPILAGAGIVGLAVGFGAQNLVRDVIAGFFMILENQVRVGDVAIINGTGGLVETITFRTIVLRDLAGVVHVIPNGAISSLANMTKEWSAYVIDVRVDYKEDTDKVVDVMRETAEALRKDPEFRDRIIEPIEIFGVDDFNESGLTIKARIKTEPIQQWSVGREYRRRLKKAFDAKEIEISFPHRSLFMNEASKPLEVLVKQVAANSNG